MDINGQKEECCVVLRGNRPPAAAPGAQTKAAMRLFFVAGDVPNGSAPVQNSTIAAIAESACRDCIVRHQCKQPSYKSDNLPASRIPQTALAMQQRHIVPVRLQYPTSTDLADLPVSPCRLRLRKRLSLARQRNNAKCQKETNGAATKATYSITSSARASSVGGTVSPSAFAVFRLITRSNLVGCSIGKSLGWAPLKSLST
jgi:hypothetical protein